MQLDKQGHRLTPLCKIAHADMGQQFIMVYYDETIDAWQCFDIHRDRKQTLTTQEIENSYYLVKNLNL